jgi:hypothetical protein
MGEGRCFELAVTLRCNCPSIRDVLLWMVVTMSLVNDLLFMRGKLKCIYIEYTLSYQQSEETRPQNTIAISAKYSVSFICQPMVFEDTIAKIHPILPA